MFGIPDLYKCYTCLNIDKLTDNNNHALHTFFYKRVLEKEGEQNL